MFLKNSSYASNPPAEPPMPTMKNWPSVCLSSTLSMGLAGSFTFLTSATFGFTFDFFVTSDLPVILLIIFIRFYNDIIFQNESLFDDFIGILIYINFLLNFMTTLNIITCR